MLSSVGCFRVFLDLNECGLKPRPCEHRCMNTYGSYKCYCLNGYMLMHDGSCASESSADEHSLHFVVMRRVFCCFTAFVLVNSDSRTCSLAHCQYGCEEVQGEIRCLCPSPGLQLGQDERTCVGEQPYPQRPIINEGTGSYSFKIRESYRAEGMDFGLHGEFLHSIPVYKTYVDIVALASLAFKSDGCN